MSNWFEREEDQLCEDLNNGVITRKEFDKSMRELREELRAQAQDAADDAYNNVMGGW